MGINIFRIYNFGIKNYIQQKTTHQKNTYDIVNVPDREVTIFRD